MHTHTVSNHFDLYRHIANSQEAHVSWVWNIPRLHTSHHPTLEAQLVVGPVILKGQPAGTQWRGDSAEIPGEWRSIKTDNLFTSLMAEIPVPVDYP